jgi:lipopolysaccharide export system protein LptA
MWVALAAAALLVAGATAQQRVRRGSVAIITADEIETSWDSGQAQMTGHVNVQIKGDYDATITAPSLTVETDLQKSQLLALTARGPVSFDIVTRSAEGKASRIVASCTDQATFSERTMIVVLKGNAHAEVTGMPRAEGVESAKYDGDSMTVDLRKHTIRLTQAHLNVEMAPPAEKGPTEAKP